MVEKINEQLNEVVGGYCTNFNNGVNMNPDDAKNYIGFKISPKDINNYCGRKLIVYKDGKYFEAILKRTEIDFDYTICCFNCKGVSGNEILVRIKNTDVTVYTYLDRSLDLKAPF